MTQADKPELAGGSDRPDGGKAAGRWKTWALVLSLGLNLFVGATVIGAGVRNHRMPQSAVRDVGLGPFTEALSRDDRAALRAAFLAAAPDIRARRREAAEDFTRLAAALRAEPWDEATVKDVLARQGRRASERFDLGRHLFVEHLGAMTSAARAALADRIDKAIERGWRK